MCCDVSERQVAKPIMKECDPRKSNLIVMFVRRIKFSHFLGKIGVRELKTVMARLGNDVTRFIAVLESELTHQAKKVIRTMEGKQIDCNERRKCALHHFSFYF